MHPFRFSNLFRIALLAASCLLINTTVRSADDSAALYKAKCAVCHAANGDASTAIGKSLKMRDLRSPEVQKQSDAELNTITACGKGKMPPYKGKLTDDQVKDLVAYIRALAKK